MSDVDETRAAGEDTRAQAGTSAQDAAFQELQRRHQLIAAELARLSTILQAAGRQEYDEISTGGGTPPATVYETAPMPGAGWERAATGGVLRGPGVRPESQRVIHLGTQRNAVAGKPRNLAVGLAAGAVGAVVAAALILLVLSPRWAANDAGFAETVDGGAASEAPASPAPEPAVAPLQPATEATTPVTQPTLAALDVILQRARTIPDLNEETAALIRRLPALSALSGPARSEEAADIYGLAVTAARTDSSGIADEIATTLEPEVTMGAVLALADRRPEVVGSGVEPLMDDLRTLPTLPEPSQQAEAQVLMDAVAAGVADQTIAGPFCNSIAKTLMEYGAEPPA